MYNRIPYHASVHLFSMVGIAWLYVLTLHFQEVLGHGPLTAGLLFVPMTLVSVVAPVAGRLATRLGVRTTASSGNASGLGVVATVIAAATAALGGKAAGAEALVGGLRWGVLACVGFAVLALPLVPFGLRGEEARKRSTA